jgi:hypothetical protein
MLTAQHAGRNHSSGKSSEKMDHEDDRVWRVVRTIHDLRGLTFYRHSLGPAPITTLITD